MLQSIAYFNLPIQKYWTDENYYGYIYLTYDQKNNLSYIGHKKAKIEKTKNYFGSGSIIVNIKKSRGTYFLKKIILGVCYSREELLSCETECKLFFNVLDRRYGYNIKKEDEGGDCFTNNPNKEEIRQKMIDSQKKISLDPIVRKRKSDAQKRIQKNLLQEIKDERNEKRSKTLKLQFENGRQSWNKGLTKETNKSVKSIGEKQKGLKHKRYGKHNTEEHNKNIGLGRKGIIIKVETRKKISDSLLGNIPWNKGLSKLTDNRIKETKWINNTFEEKMINKDKIDLFLKENWRLGRLKKFKKEK
jgi:hypothetical protein